MSYWVAELPAIHMARRLKLVSKCDEVDPICFKVGSFVGKRSLPQGTHALNRWCYKRPLGAARKEGLWCRVLQDCAVSSSGTMWDPSLGATCSYSQYNLGTSSSYSTQFHLDHK